MTSVKIVRMVRMYVRELQHGMQKRRYGHLKRILRERLRVHDSSIAFDS